MPRQAKQIKSQEFPEDIPPDFPVDGLQPAQDYNRIDLNRALRLRFHNNMSITEIADVFGVTKQAVSKRLKPYTQTSGNIEEFKKYKSDMLHEKQFAMLRELTPDKIKSMSAYQLTGMFSMLYDKTRLEDGESTENVSIDEINQRLRERQREIDELKKALDD